MNLFRGHEQNMLIPCSYRQNGRSYLGILDDVESSITVLHIPFKDIDNITLGINCLFVEGASEVLPLSVAKVTLDDHKSEAVEFEIMWSSSPDCLKYNSYFSSPKFIEFSTEVPWRICLWVLLSTVKSGVQSYSGCVISFTNVVLQVPEWMKEVLHLNHAES